MQYDTRVLDFPWKLALNCVTFCSVNSAMFLSYHGADTSLVATDTSVNRKQQSPYFHTAYVFNCKLVLTLVVKAKKITEN